MEQSNLSSGERLVAIGRVHWFVFAPGAALFILSLVLIELPPLSVPVLLFSIFSLTKAFLFMLVTQLSVTTQRLVGKTGLIRRSTIALKHSQIETILVEQDRFGRLFNFGTVVVCGAGGVRTPIARIDHPLEFQRQALAAVERANGGNA